MVYNYSAFKIIFFLAITLSFYATCSYAWSPVNGDYTFRPADETYYKVFSWPQNEARFEGNPSVANPNGFSIFNSWLKKYIGVHESGEIVLWATNTGKGERWRITGLGCIPNSWLKTFLGVHEDGKIVMWPTCGPGEKWEMKHDGCLYNRFVDKYLGVHENGQFVMWTTCGPGEKWKIR